MRPSVTILRAVRQFQAALPQGTSRKSIVNLSTRPGRTATTEMTSVVGSEQLQPAKLWSFFEQLTKIPRPSKQEAKVQAYLQQFANARNLEFSIDTAGNVVIKRPGCGGGELAPTVVIQGHIDMVCEKRADSTHDFTADPLTLKRKDDWLMADGTTLGADNGIGVATALTLLDMPSSTKLPPLECLFTVDEEAGMGGAFGIDPQLVRGRTMLNLDTEDWGEIFIGCAGGGDSIITLDVTTEQGPPDAVVCELVVEGLQGGHSGIDIGQDRGSAVLMLAAVLDALRRALLAVRIARMSGGDKRNAISRDARATLLVPPQHLQVAHSLVGSKLADLRLEYGLKEPGLAIRLEDAAGSHHSQAGGTCLADSSAERVISLLRCLPHGALKYSHAISGLVETSNNVASVQPCSSESGAPQYVVQCLTRSSIGPALESTRDRIEAVAKLCGGTVVKTNAYPGWAPDPSSSVLQLVKEVFTEVLGREPHVGAIHAGLECGLLGQKFPGMDMVSYGPTIKGAHSPDERVQISTVQPFFDATLKILARLADRR